MASLGIPGHSITPSPRPAPTPSTQAFQESRTMLASEHDKASVPRDFDRELALDLSAPRLQERRQGVEDTLSSMQNNLAREAFLRRYDGTRVNTVFAPGEYNVPDWVGDVAAIHEQFRWGKEIPTEDAARMANNLPRGLIGYVYKIFEVEMEKLDHFASQLASHVIIVDHRQMHDIAMQKRNLGKRRT